MDQTPTREVLWNITNSWIMYPLFILALGVAVYFFVRRWRLWKIGQPEDRSSQPWVRLKGAFKYSLLQLKVLERKGSGIMHVFMYVGMIILLIATVTVAAQADLGIQTVHGPFYLYFLSLTVDLAGLAFCLAMIGCLIRRFINKSLDTKPQDIFVLVALLVIGVTGFLVEGMRIEATQDPWRAWSPIGNACSYLFAGWTPGQIEAAHQFFWWFHMALAFALIAYWTYSKLVHVLLVPAATYYRSLAPKGELPFIDMEDEDLLTLGVGTLEEFTWKDLFDTEACIRCNRCQEVCPAYNTGKPLSPKELMQNLRAELEERGPLVYRVQKQAQKLARNEVPASKGSSQACTPESTADLLEAAPLSESERSLIERPLVGAVINPDTLWSCTTCAACMQACPALLEHVPKIVKMRTHQVSMESAFPPEAQSTFRNLENNGNPWGLGWQTRTKWTEGLGVPTLAENPAAEYLYWPGCSGAFDSRNRKVSIALVKLLQAAGVDFALLGNEEKCCGDAARRMGNEMVYFMLASENIATMQAYGVKKIIVQCPHCFQALTRDYPQLGGNFEVIHHTELLEHLVQEGALKVPAALHEKICYHDSCYLGRYQDVYDPPRSLIKHTGAHLVEMPCHGAQSFCCGAGGGRMWLEENTGTRINNERASQALATEADALATACPFCLTMLSDGMLSLEGNQPVLDIAEILAEAINHEPAA